jgi:hypothetical protein
MHRIDHAVPGCSRTEADTEDIARMPDAWSRPRASPASQGDSPDLRGDLWKANTNDGDTKRLQKRAKAEAKMELR